jgi:NADH-quinone oxidoreductase subunit L
MGGMRKDLRITFVVFLIAVASLSGIPPLSGFWSKDAVLATAWSSGQYLLFFVGVATAGMTAFYSFRMLGIIFFGKKSPHLEESETEGRHVHEVSPLGWVPYTVLGIGTLVIGLLSLIGVLFPMLNVEGALEWASRTYLSTLVSPTASLTGSVPAGFEIAPAGIVLVFALVGVFAAWSIYIAGRYSPTRFVGPTGFMHGLYKFLENRWYINAIYYRVFVDPVIASSRWLQNYFEIGFLERVNLAGSALGYGLSRAFNWIDVKVIDGVANGMATAGQSLSLAARRIQSGVTEQYVLVFSLGLLVLLVALVLALGVHIF